MNILADLHHLSVVSGSKEELDNNMQGKLKQTVFSEKSLSPNKKSSVGLHEAKSAEKLPPLRTNSDIEPKRSPKLEQLKKTQTIRELMHKDKKTLLNLKSTWSNTKDISHLKDTRDPQFSPQIVKLPTAIAELEEQLNSPEPISPRKERITKDNFFEQLYVQPEGGFTYVPHLGGPTGRQDIENLTRWFAYMKETHLSDVSGPEYYRQATLIHKTCLRELVRQVTVHCIERGKLLKEVIAGIEQLTDEHTASTIKETQHSLQQKQDVIQELERAKIESAEKNDSDRLQVLEKVSEYLNTINYQRSQLAQKEETVLSLQQALVSAKQQAANRNKTLDLLFASLEAHQVTVNPQVMEYVKGHNVSQTCPVDEVVFVAPPDSVSRETQTELPQRRCHPRYIVQKALDVNCDETISGVSHKYEVVENYHSACCSDAESVCDYQNELEEMGAKTHTGGYRRISPEMSPEIPPEDYSRNYQANYSRDSIGTQQKYGTSFNTHRSETTEQMYIELESSLTKHLPKNCHFLSWKAGVIVGLKKGRKVGFEEAQVVYEEQEESELQSGSGSRPCSQAHPLRQQELDDEPMPSQRTLVRSRTAFAKKPRSRKLLSGFAVKNSRTTKFIEFNWSRRKSSVLYPKRRYYSGSHLLQAILRKPLNRLKEKGSMSVRMMNKIILSTYMSCIHSSKVTEPKDFVEVAYGEFLKKYGLCTVANRKFTDLVCSLLNYPTDGRRTFLRFLGASVKLSVPKYSKYSLRLFLASYQYLNTAKVGIDVPNNEQHDDRLFPALRALECLREVGEKFLDRATLGPVHAWVEKYAVADPRRTNHLGLIKGDEFILHLLDAFEAKQAQVHQAVSMLFEALAAKNDVLALGELEMSVRLLNPRKLRLLLGDEAESDSATSVLSQMQEFQRFSQVYELCLRKDLFSLTDIRRTCLQSDQVSRTVQETKPELDAIVNCMEGQRTWRSLLPHEFASRLEALSLCEGKTEVVSLGWAIYSAELRSIRDELLNNCP